MTEDGRRMTEKATRKLGERIYLKTSTIASNNITEKNMKYIVKGIKQLNKSCD
jgi:hypothetical protein